MQGSKPLQIPSQEQPSTPHQPNDEQEQSQAYVQKKSGCNYFRYFVLVTFIGFVIVVGWLLRGSFRTAGGVTGMGENTGGSGSNRVDYQYGHILELSTLLRQFYTGQQTNTILDINCGYCTYIHSLHLSGFSTTIHHKLPLLTQSIRNKQPVQILDWSIEQNTGKMYDWAQSLSMEGYVKEGDVGKFVGNVGRHVRRGVVVGEGRVGVRGRLRELFVGIGWEYDDQTSVKFRAYPGMLWFRSTIMIFRRKTGTSTTTLPPPSNIPTPSSPSTKPPIPLSPQSPTSTSTSASTSLKSLLSSYPSLTSKIYNPSSNGLSLPQIPSLALKLQKYPTVINNIDYQEYGLHSRIQVASRFDFAGLGGRVDWAGLQREIYGAVGWELLEFKYEQSRESKQEVLTFTAAEIEELSNTNIDGLQLAAQLAQNPTSSSTLKKQLYFYTQKYPLSSTTTPSQQTPICIFSMSTNLHSKSTYKPLLESLNRQNYSNFHIVYVDDFSEQDNLYKIIEYLAKENMRINNRIRFVNVRSRVGGIGNIWMWVRMYCGDGEIVVITDGDGGFVGNQGFRVLDTLYRNQQYWYIYSSYINYYPSANRYTKGTASSDFTSSTAFYRRQQNIWITSHLKTFRKKLLDIVPIQYFLQYHYNEKEGVARPAFFMQSFDRFLVYALLELAGDDRISFVEDVLYMYNAEPVMDVKCYMEHVLYDEFKARIQTSLGKLAKWQDKPRQVEGATIDDRLLASLKAKYDAYRNCMAF